MKSELRSRTGRPAGPSADPLHVRHRQDREICFSCSQHDAEIRQAEPAAGAALGLFAELIEARARCFCENLEISEQELVAIAAVDGHGYAGWCRRHVGHPDGIGCLCAGAARAG